MNASGGFTGPYRGLEPFDEESAAFFFGRERETRLVTASLFAAPLTLLYGASGVGKSSVLRAGVLPRLRERADILPVFFPRLGSHPTRGTTIERGWQTDPVSGLKETAFLALLASAHDDEALTRKYQDAMFVHDMSPLREYFDAISEVSGRRLMVVLDQFEEYSLYHPDEELFAVQFPKAIVSGSRSASYLVSLREDALAKLDRFKGKIPTLWDSYRRIDHLDAAAGEDAIRLPLREYNRRLASGEPPVDIEDPLVAEVLRDVQAEVEFEGTGTGTVAAAAGSTGRIETPYLQLVMTRLWERERAESSQRLRLATLQAEGGAAEIVRTHLDRVMSQFSAEDRDIAARIFHRLVTPSGSKIAFSVRDLAEYESLPSERVAPILAQLEEGSRRILRRVAVSGAGANDPRYEIFHDRLGKAILSWRAKRLAEQAREQNVRQEAEQQRIVEQTRRTVRDQIDAALAAFDSALEHVLAAMLPYLVSPTGTSFLQTAADVAQLSKQPRPQVDRTLRLLVDAGILREARLETSTDDTFFEIAHDAFAQPLLEWHSRFVQTNVAKIRGVESKQMGPAVTLRRPDQTETDSFPYEIFGERLLQARVIPLLGAGVTLSGRQVDRGARELDNFPTPFELKELLARTCNFPAAHFETSDISVVASFFVRQQNRESLDELLERAFDRPQQPSATHRLIAEAAKTTPSMIILTTNYDTLMEQALGAAGVPFSVLSYLRDDPGADAPGRLALQRFPSKDMELVQPYELKPMAEPLVFRLYGGARFPRGGGYVLTEEDHLDWVVRLGPQGAMLPVFVLSTLWERNLLSLGLSASAWPQRGLLRVFLERSNRPPGWAVTYRPSQIDIMTWQRYDITVFAVELNDWATRARTVMRL